MRKKIGSCIDKTVSYILYGVLLFVAAVLVYILLIPRKRIERFQETSKSSRSLYRTSKNFLSDLNTYFSTLSDNNDILLMQSCVQFQQDSPAWFRNDCYFTANATYSASFDQIRTKIVSNLQDFVSKNNGKPIKGDVYVILFQSPYMRDEAGNVLSMQYNVSSYDYSPVNIMKSGANVKDTTKPLMIGYFMFYVNYYMNMSERPPFDIHSALSKFKVNKDQCFIGCQGDTTETYCGCVNTKAWSGDPNSYASSCSSTPLPNANGIVDATKNVVADFFVLYKINRLSTTITSAVKFE